ncbi:hypothetical protein [Mycobacterium antarcticum]|uniref:hypothetical protein n=1 Tax=Mycolicibacterium sp. TUM20984 TaxID=3023368 RepID=UPI00238B2096|nr:hypothetical protein [Mycolicibacterium sp. TUM20984]GLP83566.1 hypothetical protein TUM20984_49860 [Mycolicibacterium sp. TUM20984]
MTTNSTKFPILDAPRDQELTGRAILDVHGYLEPYIDETDYWVAMPIRLVHSPLAGVGLEVGPYTLAHDDINKLRDAIRSYDDAVGPQ